MIARTWHIANVVRSIPKVGFIRILLRAGVLLFKFSSAFVLFLRKDYAYRWMECGILKKHLWYRVHLSVGIQGDSFHERKGYSDICGQCSSISAHTGKKATLSISTLTNRHPFTCIYSQSMIRCTWSS